MQLYHGHSAHEHAPSSACRSLNMAYTVPCTASSTTPATAVSSISETMTHSERREAETSFEYHRNKFVLPWLNLVWKQRSMYVEIMIKGWPKKEHRMNKCHALPSLGHKVCSCNDSRHLGLNPRSSAKGICRALDALLPPQS